MGSSCIKVCTQSFARSTSGEEFLQFPRRPLLRLSEKSEQASNLGSVSPHNGVKALLPYSYRPTSLSCDSTPTTFQTVSLGYSVNSNCLPSYSAGSLQRIPCVRPPDTPGKRVESKRKRSPQRKAGERDKSLFTLGKLEEQEGRPRHE